MPISVVSRTSAVQNTDSTTHNVNFGGFSVAANDIIIVHFTCDTNATITGWGSYTLLDAGQNGGTGSRSEWGWIRASGGETDFTLTTGTAELSCSFVWVIRGAHTTSAPEVPANAQGSSTTPDPPSLTPSWGSDTNLWIATVGVNQSPAYSAYPTNYATGQRAQATTGGSLSSDRTSQGAAERILAAATEDPGTFTVTSNQWRAQTIAVRQAPAAAVQPRRALLFVGI